MWHLRSFPKLLVKFMKTLDETGEHFRLVVPTLAIDGKLYQWRRGSARTPESTCLTLRLGGRMTRGE